MLNEFNCPYSRSQNVFPFYFKFEYKEKDYFKIFKKGS